MIKQALMHILGLDERTSSIVELLLVRLDKATQVEEHLLNLSDEVMSAFKQMDGIIDDPDDPDNSDYSQLYRRHNTDGWSPDEDRTEAELYQSLSKDQSSVDQYQPPVGTFKESHKQTLLQYLMVSENLRAQVDNDMIKMGDELDDDIDPVTQKRIDAYLQQGNKQAADRLRTRSLRNASATAPTAPKTPTQALVDAKKRQLSQALQADARNKAPNQQQDE